MQITIFIFPNRKHKNKNAATLPPHKAMIDPFFETRLKYQEAHAETPRAAAIKLLDKNGLISELKGPVVNEEGFTTFTANTLPNP